MYRQMYRMYRPTHCSLLRHTLLHVTAVHAVLSPLLPAASPVLLNALPGYPAASTTRPDVPFHLPTTLPQAAAAATCLRAAAPPSTPSCTAQARRCSYTTPHLARSAAACAVQRHAHQPAGPPNPAPSSLPLTLPFLPPQASSRATSVWCWQPTAPQTWTPQSSTAQTTQLSLGCRGTRSGEVGAGVAGVAAVAVG